MSESKKHIEDNKNILCKILWVEPDGKHHQFICRNLNTGKKFEVYTKYEYFYRDFKQSNNGLNLNYWYNSGFRQVINRLIEFETELLWNDEGDNGPLLVESDDKFCEWLEEHNENHSGPCLDFFDSNDSENETFPDRNTKSPIEEI